ncbi:MAG TPA: GGDEF domain-containing protein [Xanthobacteraceae bacterium]|nr:GGDEF domain-containing protein [Xanthobacteraceae bacterium]
MAVPQDEHERTLAFAEIALGQIKALAQPASPRNFEIWYNYATGYNLSLNQSINELLARNGTLTAADLDQIYESFIAPNRITDRIDTVGARVLDEITQVLDMIHVAADSATSYSDSLADVSKKLEHAKDGEGLRAVIDRLIQGAQHMELNNKKLEARLSASKQEIEQLQHNLEAVRSESQTDPLTMLSNRKFFDQEFDKAVAAAKKGNEPLALLMSDVDRFKSFNDKYGHLTGDQVLRLVAVSMKQNVKDADIAARYGGEEFVVALPNTPLPAAMTIAEHIRRAVMNKELMKRSSGERLGRVTISIGVAVLRSDDTAQSLLERADACLYSAKHNGRNCVLGESEIVAIAGAEAAPPAQARVA